MNAKCIAVALILAAIGGVLVSSAVADPWPDEALKFYQMPLNNGATPYLVPAPPTYPPLPAAIGYGSVLSTAIFPGHDELSTAIAYDYAPDPNGTGVVPIKWQGVYMADDFADYAGTPVTHVRWWGSYMNQHAGNGVKRFLISFEHNVPAGPDPLNPTVILPSHPDFDNPDNLHQIVEFVGGAAPPPPGTFTEIPVLTPAGPVLPIEPLIEYNAELNLDKWFHEKAASHDANNVYWLKIVALVDPQRDGQIEWGWHNRDWSIPDALAAKPGDTPDGAEHIQGFVPGGPDPDGQPIWHFEDDAVQGEINVTPGMSPIMPNVQQFGFDPKDYILPWDLPTITINQHYSKDLAFELYTRVIPEPCTLGLMAIAAIAFTAMRRRS